MPSAREPVGGRRGGRAIIPSRAFQYGLAVAGATAILGLWVDIWAHLHEATSPTETFFTPWHGVMYGGIGATGALVGGLWLARRPSRRAFPPGLTVSFAGVLVFGLGGGADLVWHAVFGVEANLEALLSPTHLALYLAAFLVFVGPLRMRRLLGLRQDGWPGALPAVAAVACVVQLAVVLSQFANPAGYPYASASYVAEFEPTARAIAEPYGYLGLIFTTLLTAALTLGITRYIALPVGAWTVILGLSTVGVALSHDQLTLALTGLAAGVAADVALGRGAAPGPGRLRLAAAAVPLAWSASYFALIALTDRIWWSPHIVASALVVPAFVGLAVALLVVPTAAMTRWGVPATGLALEEER